jgi:hypothetical protein
VENDIFLSIAELALAVAGFSGVITAFMKRPGKLSIVEVYRIAVLLGITFGAVFLALLPVVLEQFGLGGTRLWTSVSTVMAVCSTIALGVFLYSSRLIHRLAPRDLQSVHDDRHGRRARHQHRPADRQRRASRRGAFGGHLHRRAVLVSDTCRGAVLAHAVRSTRRPVAKR